ncbi:hypothetical protein [Geminocystis sp. NIES-3709]|uniref:hypothetical protein n=1 Tax=Geminocystis sp. NIES-3709 TaxID=1617448 RepID=UPI0005FCB52C|nr:hypothetical protein [Geminocystis sp. NIES-3709]BAQ65735.1 hypothetical protein GM3709_2500 [Geminocystis sp. NIES-3709]
MNFKNIITWEKFKNVSLFIFGFLLSPLCWWNDLIINLPLAYGFGKIISIFSADLLIPASIFGYWLSNIIGVLLMQLGTVNFLNESNEEKNLGKNIWMGIGTSTVFTIVAVILWQTNLLDLSLPSFLNGTTIF